MSLVSISELPRREPLRETLAAIREAEDIVRGVKANRVGETHRGSIMGEERFREEAARLVDMGRLVADPVYVRRIEWAKIANSLDRLWLFHQDLVGLFVGKKIDTLGEFFHTHLKTSNIPPIYRVDLPHPALESNWGGAMDQSCNAMEKGDIASLLRRFIVWAGFIRRFTKAQRAAFKERKGRDLLDQYWEVKCYAMTPRICGRPVPLDLFLPAGMDYTILPFEEPGEPLRFIKGPADPLVQAAGYKAFSGDYLSIPVSLTEVEHTERITRNVYAQSTN